MNHWKIHHKQQWFFSWGLNSKITSAFFMFRSVRSGFCWNNFGRWQKILLLNNICTIGKNKWIIKEEIKRHSFYVFNHSPIVLLVWHFSIITYMEGIQMSFMLWYHPIWEVSVKTSLVNLFHAFWSSLILNKNSTQTVSSQEQLQYGVNLSVNVFQQHITLS